jgi:hypothetical protein
MQREVIANNCEGIISFLNPKNEILGDWILHYIQNDNVIRFVLFIGQVLRRKEPTAMAVL